MRWLTFWLRHLKSDNMKPACFWHLSPYPAASEYILDVNDTMCCSPVLRYVVTLETCCYQGVVIQEGPYKMSESCLRTSVVVIWPSRWAGSCGAMIQPLYQMLFCKPHENWALQQKVWHQLMRLFILWSLLVMFQPVVEAVVNHLVCLASQGCDPKGSLCNKE